MKQAEVITGKEYLFTKTDVEHRKFMEGTIVKVVGRKGGKKKLTEQHYITVVAKGPVKYKVIIYLITLICYSFSITISHNGLAI